MPLYRRVKPKWSPKKNLSKLYGNKWAWFRPAPIKETQRNLTLYTSDLSATGWIRGATTATYSQTDSQGTSTAAALRATNTATSIFSIYRTLPTLSANVDYTSSWEAKLDQIRYVTVTISTSATAWVAATFDLQTGSVTKTGNGAAGTYVSSSCVDAGGGYYRCAVTGKVTTSAAGFGELLLCPTGTPTYSSYGEPTVSLTSGDGAYIARPMFALASLDPTYQPIGASWDATYTAKYPGEVQYQDSAGTTAVTAAAQSVGFLRPSFPALVLSNTEIVSNGTFTTDTTGWSARGSDSIAVVSGELRWTVAGSGGGFQQTVSGLTTGASYMLTLTARSGTYVGEVALTSGGGFISGQTVSIALTATNSEFSIPFTAAAASGLLVISRNAVATGTTFFDNISLRQITGGYALQATTANKPTYYTDARSVPVLRHDTTDGLTATLPAGFSGFPSCIANGTFTDSSGLTLTTGWTVSGGTLNVNTTATNTTYQSLGVGIAAVVIGRQYKITYTITTVSGTGVRAFIGGQFDGSYKTSAGTYSATLTTTTTDGFLFQAGSTNTIASIDNVSVNEITPFASLYYANQWGVQQVHSLPIYDTYSLPGKPAATVSTSDDVYEYILTPSRLDSKNEDEVIKYLNKQIDTTPADWKLIGPTYWRRHQRSRSTYNTSTADTLITPTGTYPTIPRGCVLMEDGSVFSMPSDSTTSYAIYNPTTDTLTTKNTTLPGSSSFINGVLLLDGRVFCLPYMSTTARIYNPITDTLSTPTGTYPGNYAFIGGVLLPDGRVFCVPHNSTTARIYNPITDTLSTPTGTYPGGSAFQGGVLLSDGRVFCVPFDSTTARIYNPITDTLTTPTGTYPGLNSFAGGVLLPDGRVFCVPYNSTTARIYNPITDTLTTPTGTYPGSLVGGVLLPDGRVFCIPFSSVNARIYNPITDTLTTPTGIYPGNSAFYGGVLLLDGRVFCAPRGSTTARIYDGGYGPQTSARVLSAYDNKF